MSFTNWYARLRQRTARRPKRATYRLRLEPLEERTLLNNPGSGTFAPPLTFAASYILNSVAVGDFNGDAKLDVAAASIGTFVPDIVSVFLGNGNGTFGPESTFAVPAPASVAVGDFNGDGKLDLATANRTSPGSVSVLLGKGNGAFGPPTNFATGPNPHALVVGDFNGDGNLDLATAQTDGEANVSVLLGKGDGTFRPPTAAAVGIASGSMALGDFNGDGKLDLAVAGRAVYPSGVLSILLGHGDGTFALPATFDPGRSPSAVAVGDFDGDRKLDLAVSNQSPARVPPGDIGVLRGKGDGTFGPPATLAITKVPNALVVEDFNGDGKLDVAISSSLDGISVFLGNGNGNGAFGPQTNYIAGSHQKALAVGDFNGDGAPDLVAAGSVYPGSTGRLSLLLNQPANGFIPFGVRVFVTGADAGGGPDVKVFNAANDQPFSNFFPFDPGFTGGVRVAVGDVNGDRVPDIICAAGPGGGPNVVVVSGANRSLLYNFFAYDQNFTGGVFVAAGDVNGDGHADIICGADAGGGPNVTVFSGADGLRLLSFFPYDPRFSGGIRVGAGDIDSDGKDEIITGAGRGGGPNVTVYQFRNGQAVVLQSYFAYNQNFTAGIYVAAGDVNGDGKADVIVGAGAGGGPNVTVFDGVTRLVLRSFFVYDPAFSGGVRVAGLAMSAGGQAFVVCTPGPGGGPNVRIVSGLNGQQIDSFFAYDPTFTGGLFVAAVSH